MPKSHPFWRIRDLCHTARDRRNEPAEVLLHQDQDEAAEAEWLEAYIESQERFVYDFLFWEWEHPKQPDFTPPPSLPNPPSFVKKGRDYREGMINNARPALLW